MLSIIALLKQEASRATRRLTRKLIAGIIASVFCAVAAGFAIAAGYMGLASVLDPIAACLIIAGIFLILAAISLAVLLRKDTPRPVAVPVASMPAAAPADPIQAASSLLSALASPKLSKSTILQLAAAGLLVGLAAGRRVTRK